MIQVGRFQVLSVVTGRYRLDGGAMFGVVPKVLWQRKAPADELNRISMAMRTLVAFAPDTGQLILTDTGAGHKWPADEAERFAIEPDPNALPAALAHFGRHPADVTDIVVTHLHFDHNGGLTDWSDPEAGKTRLCFPNAQLWIHEDQWQHANAPSSRDRASYLERDLAALRDTPNLKLVRGADPSPPFEGLRWAVTSGHTPGQLLPVFCSDDADLLFVGDTVPTTAHLEVPWIMAFDLQPLLAIQEKQRIYQQCYEKGLRLAFPHDPDQGGAAIARSDRGKPIVCDTLDL